MNSSLFGGLAEPDRRLVLAAARRRRFRRREVVFHEGDPGDTIHVVVSGHVGIKIVTPLGDVAMVRVIGAGGFFGELALLDPAPRAATALALDATETFALHRDQFDELLRQSPEAARVVTLALVAEVRRLAGALVDAMYLPAEKRLWRRLCELVAIYDGGLAGTVTIPLTQDEIAELAGLTRPTANRLLREAQDDAAITLARGKVEIRDLPWILRRAR